MREIMKDIWSWAWYSEEKGYNFNGTVLCGEGMRVLIDPVQMPDEAYEALKKMQPFEAVYLTNKDHERMSYRIRRDLGVPIGIHEKDAGLLKEKPDFTFREGEKLACGIEVIHLPDQKSPGECAFYLFEKGVLILGDALIGGADGSLRLLPPGKYKDPAKARAGLNRLRSLYFDALLLGDGEPVLLRAHDRLEQFFLKDLAQSLNKKA